MPVGCPATSACHPSSVGAPHAALVQTTIVVVPDPVCAVYFMCAARSYGVYFSMLPYVRLLGPRVGGR